MNLLRKSVALMITLIMMFSMFGVYNESLAVTLDEINKKEAKLAKEDKAVQDAQKKVTQLKVKIENMKKDKRTYTNAYYDAVDELKVALKDLEKKKNTYNAHEKEFLALYDEWEAAEWEKKRNKENETKSNTSSNSSSSSKTSSESKKSTSSQTSTSKASTTKKADEYKFVLNRGPRINKLTSDKSGVTLELNDGDPINSILVYKTEKEVRTTKDKDTKVSNENKTLKILKSVIGNDNKFKIVLKDKNENTSKFYMTAKKDGDTFKTNRSPKMTEETGFGDKTYKDKDTAKKESKLSFKISDGSKSLKNIVIYDNDKEVSKFENIKKGVTKTYLNNNYCKIYSKAGEDFIRLDIYTKKFEMKNSQINVKIKATDEAGLPTVEHLNIKLVKK